jgi:hypothetical protein
MSEPLGGDPFAEGIDAFGRGVQREECPYQGNRIWRWWLKTGVAGGGVAGL